jgi:hypothetical protein
MNRNRTPCISETLGVQPIYNQRRLQTNSSSKKAAFSKEVGAIIMCTVNTRKEDTNKQKQKQNKRTPRKQRACSALKRLR